MAAVAGDVLTRAGLSAEDVASWRGAAPTVSERFGAAAMSTSEYLRRGEDLLARLPERPARNPAEQEAAQAIARELDAARERFLHTHADELYGVLTDGVRRQLRLEELVYQAAERVPGLAPTRAAMAAERDRRLADKAGIEVAQGLLLAHLLASPRAGAHLIHCMQRPTPQAHERLEHFRATGVADLGAAHLQRRGRHAVLELRNPRHLNAEDGDTLGATECAVDLVLLDPHIELGVFRGGVVEHPRYAGRRIFGAGINLTHLYHGRIDFLFYVTRDLGYVNKLYRGLAGPEHRPGAPEDGIEKPWIAAVETYAIGGACQLLHVMDHVIATRGARLYLPARKEGIIPGASPLRLARSVGDRLARQAILSGLEFEAGTAQGDLLCDQVVEAEAVESAIEARVSALTSSGLVNAAANRRAMRAGAEPLDLFRSYMATYCREQAYCHLSPALVHNLEQHWNAQQRSV